MKLIVRTPVSQRKIEIADASQLDAAIKGAFKIEKYQLFSNLEHTEPLNTSSLTDGTIIYMNYDVQKPKTYKQENTCTHGTNVTCYKCAALNPRDRAKEDSKEVKVKYMSYGSFKEMLKDQNKEEPEYNYEIKLCKNHGANTRCMKCMEKAITLEPQVYRRIDYVEFDNIACVSNFRDKWYNSRKQQIGLLVGRILPHSELPNAKKAVISGIWEIEQENYPDGAVLQCLPSKFICDDLQIVGMIYTDLLARNSTPHSFKLTRNYTISTVELNFIYEVQAHIKKNEFVAVCLEPTESGEDTLECYMLSAQFMALMRSHVLILSDKPDKFTTKRTVRYFVQNEYGKNVPKETKPEVPVDYFIVKCEAGYKDNSLFKSTETIKKPTLSRLAMYFDGDFGFEKFQSFPILMEVSKYYTGAGSIVSAVVNRNKEEFDKLAETEGFKKFTESLKEAKKISVY